MTAHPDLFPGAAPLVDGRRELDDYYTPPALAEVLLDWTDDVWSFEGARVVEPSVGGGSFARAASARGAWVLGIDMSHMGRRYGDSFSARAAEGEMATVARRDRERIERLVQGDAEGFWTLVQEGGDPLKWCGSAPCYAFLRATGPVAGELLRYDQWNIDDDSVVSFAGMAFRRATQGAGE